MWHLMMVAIIAELVVIVVLICVTVHYAREGAENKGRMEILERIIAEDKTVPIGGKS